MRAVFCTAQRNEDRGLAMLEFALVLPVLLLVTSGILGFGWYYHQQISLQAAVREGARELALDGEPGDVDLKVLEAAPSVDINSIVQEGCPSSGDGEATVTASAPYDFPLPFFPFLDGRTLTAKGVMRCGL